MSDSDPAWAAARRKRNLAIATALGAFVLIVFVVTMIRLAQGGTPRIQGAAPESSAHV